MRQGGGLDFYVSVPRARQLSRDATTCHTYLCGDIRLGPKKELMILGHRINLAELLRCGADLAMEGTQPRD